MCQGMWKISLRGNNYRVAKLYGLYGLFFINPKIVRIVRICFQIVRIVRIFILENTPVFLNFHSFQQIFHEN